MNENNGTTRGVDEPAPIHMMTITLNEQTGQLNVDGIPKSMVTALGMIRLAEAVVMQARQKQPQGRIIAPPPGVRLG